MNDVLFPFEELRGIIRSRRKKAIERNVNYKLFGSILKTALIITAFILFFNTWFGFKIVHGNGMFPALSDGDLTIVYQEKSYIKNDVVFFTVNGKEFVGRVVAKGGDLVDITENGDLLVNGTRQSGEIVYKTFPRDSWEGQIEIPNGTFFILGDNRSNSYDSRDFGCVPIADINGKIIAFVRHRGI